MKEYYSIVMIGATGAVGGEAAKVLSKMPQIERLTLLGRRENENLKGSSITQHVIDLFDPSSYQELLTGHDIAICTLGVGQPSKMSKEDFVRIDRDVVLNFASSCKKICPKDCFISSPTLNCLWEKGALSFCRIIKFFFLFL